LHSSEVQKSIYKTNFIGISHLQLSYNYFRFGKTNVRHIGILLPVATSTISQ